MSDAVFVSVDLAGRPVDVGTAYFSRRRTVLSTTFRYDEAYLARPDAYAVDPAMPLAQGNHTVNGMPGALSDCSPDRWGRNLIAKLVRVRALREGRTSPAVSDVDYLLGVSDLTRQGGLRFRTSPDGPYLDPDLTVPKLVELPRLLQAADAAARDPQDRRPPAQSRFSPGRTSRPRPAEFFATYSTEPQPGGKPLWATVLPARELSRFEDALDGIRGMVTRLAG